MRVNRSSSTLKYLYTCKAVVMDNGSYQVDHPNMGITLEPEDQEYMQFSLNFNALGMKKWHLDLSFAFQDKLNTLSSKVSGICKRV